MCPQACYIYSVRTKQGVEMTVEMKVRRMVSEHGRVKTREMILSYKKHLNTFLENPNRDNSKVLESIHNLDNMLKELDKR